MKIETIIDKNDAGQRADRYVRHYLAALSLARIQSLFRKKEIKVNRKAIDRAHMLAAGDKLEIYGLTPEQAAGAGLPAGKVDGVLTSTTAGFVLRTSAPAFPILFEDEDLLVVNKPAGMAVHPGTGITPGRSLIELAQAYLGRKSSLFQPALVHRLDKETSGVLLIAKTGAALRELTAALRAGALHKEYAALLIGKPPHAKGTLHDTLERLDSRHGGAKSVVHGASPNAEPLGEGKEAITHYEIVESLGAYTLVRAIIETGRMHQIRAQFSHANCPLAGDRRYAPAEANATVKETLGLRRLFLHAKSLAWDQGRKSRVFEAPLPNELQEVMNRLRAQSSQRTLPAA